jgi:hypothetical protein
MHSGSGKEIRFQFGEQPGVNRPVERPTGRLTPTGRHAFVGRSFVCRGLLTLGDAPHMPKIWPRELGGLSETFSEYFLLTV